MSEPAVVHLANCPIARNEPGACIGCEALTTPPEERVYKRPSRKNKPKSAYLRAQNANYMRDRRQRPKRIEGEDLRYDSLDHLPPIEVDANGYAKKPPTPPEAWKYNFTLEQRKVRFLLYWNYAGGNWTVAAQFAGVPRDLAEKWFRAGEAEYDARMAPLMDRARKEISDRMRLRLFQIAGLVNTPKPVAVNTSALMAIVKEYGIDVPPELAPPPPAPDPAMTAVPAVGGIPRPNLTGL